ncbi:MAG: dephospho-CoA kinase [Oscillibacter sp.]|nr:dephospho-CoA kinase [Oscillibacter sp.]
MTVIGITGPTGAGKTTALDVLAEMDFEIVDCDALYYRLLRTDEHLRQALREAFGEVFLPDGTLDRRRVAKRVFGNQKELAKLNNLVFPAVSAAVEQKIQKCSQKGLAIDAINLVESGMGRLCDVTVAVTAPSAIRLKRIMTRDALTGEQARARIEAQKPADWYRENCAFLLENQEADRGAFEVMARTFFKNLMETMNEGEKCNGSEGMEREAPHGEKERL